MIFKRVEKRHWFVMILLSLVLLIATSTAQAAHISPLLVTLDFTGLEDLGNDFVYEGWAIVNGAPVSTGTFTIDENGVPSQSTFAFEADFRQVAAFVLTIEPNPDPDPAPSDTHVVAGDFNGRHASLSVAHPAALGNDFSGASGSFILAAPSGASVGASYTQGIWWLDPAAGPGPSLNLPTLPAGWSYEGWVVGSGGPVSTGRFTALDAADSDGGGPNAGPDPTPPFPGQDFVNPPTDLTGYAAVITIEPSPDNSPAPFAFKPLVDGDIEDLGAAGLSQDMGNNAASLATGTATLAQAVRYQVTVENLATGQPLTPPIVATHRNEVGLFTVGEQASPEVEAIAENGDASGAAALLSSLPQVSNVVATSVPLTPHGTQVGDFTDSVTIDILARRGDRISLATMLICTNDGFTGLDGAWLPLHGSATYYINAYDAGTEANTELSVDIVDPCSALGPVVLNGDPNGNENDAVNTSGIIQHHDGILGGGDLLPGHDWDNPVAKVTITRVDD
jgi:hypothetical protein